MSELLQDSIRWVCAWSSHSLGKEHLLCSYACMTRQSCGQALVLEWNDLASRPTRHTLTELQPHRLMLRTVVSTAS